MNKTMTLVIAEGDSNNKLTLLTPDGSEVTGIQDISVEMPIGEPRRINLTLIDFDVDIKSQITSL